MPRLDRTPPPESYSDPYGGGPTQTRRGFEDWATSQRNQGLPYTTQDTSIKDGRVQSSGGRLNFADFLPLLLAAGGVGIGALAGGGAAGAAGGAAASGAGLGQVPLGAFGTTVGGTVGPTAASIGAGGSMGFMDILGKIGGLGRVLGNAAGSRSNQRAQENAGIASENIAKASMYGTEQGAQFDAGQQDLDRKKFTEDARGGRAKQAMIADLLSNLQDVNVTVPGITNATISGGLRPSALGATGRQASGELSKQALMALMQGDTFTGGNLLPPPQLQGMKQESGLEKFLSLAGLVGSGAGAFALDDPNAPAKFGVLSGGRG